MTKQSKRLAERRRRQQRRNMRAVGVALAIVAIVVAVILLQPPAAVCPTDDANNRCAVLQTASGTVVFEIEEQWMPQTSSHFIGLFESGYYSGLKWHRVEDWVIQTGEGSTVQPINLETNPNLQNVRGAVAVARTSDPNSGSSQFYILRSDAHHLDGDYAVFGVVRQGMDVVDSIQLNEVISSITVVSHYPA